MRAIRGECSRGAPPPTRERLRALARAYPGALRELDRTPTQELETRHLLLVRASEGRALEPQWAAVLARYHGLWSLAIAARSGAASAGVFRIDAGSEEALRRQLTSPRSAGGMSDGMFALAGAPWGLAADRVRALLDGRAQVERLTGA